ncbi:hypothetical protein CRUP_031112 [Coryphaenoides rupestris]|nr:hypothetical protein CRUP_031112 [Coryphaenoides rupestris]
MRYQSSQQHPQAQHLMQYHSMGQYAEGSREEPVMTELSVLRELPSSHQELLSHQSYYPQGSQQAELDYHHNFRESQPPAFHSSPQQDFPGHHEEPGRAHQQLQPVNPAPAPAPGKRKRGRPPKQHSEDSKMQTLEMSEEEAAKKAKRALNRFNGMSVAEVMAKTLPDVITYNLDILIIGINPGLLSAFKGRHYPNPGNHFWKCLFLSGLSEVELNYMHDESLPGKYGIGFTNMEIREGGIYEIFCKEIFGVKAKNLEFGLQPYKIPETGTVCYLMPSSSPRCAQFPRAQDKVHFYIKLKELRDQIKGSVPSHEVLETEYSFDLQLAKEDAKRISIKEEQVDPEYENCDRGGREDARQGTSHCSISRDKKEGHSIQSTQQFQALQAQYSGFSPHHHPHYPDVPAAEQATPHMAAHPEPMMGQQEPANPTKPPARKRGRPAQPKEPQAPKIPKEPKLQRNPSLRRNPSLQRSLSPLRPPKAPKDPNGAQGQARPQTEGKQEKIDESFKKVKRKIDRFKGMSEEEVMTKTLPDLLEYNLDYVIGSACSCLASRRKLLNQHARRVAARQYKIGFTNMVARATPGSKDLSSKELREGGKILTEKLIKYKPLIAVFNGKCIYEMFCREMFGKKPKTLSFGLQPHKIPDCDVALYLMPSSSARCAQFPRAQDKVHFYIKLREAEGRAEGQDAKRMSIKEEAYDPGYEDAYGGAYVPRGT